jgi:ABC-type amino acid transport substrate-binding protein
MKTLLSCVAAIIVLAVLFAVPPVSFGEEGTQPMPLRVGVTPDSPPMIFKSGGTIKGLEADFAALLAQELKRPLAFVELPWDREIPALIAGKIDIIMSGMTITRARQVRIAFSDHYLKSGLVAAMRIDDADRYGSLQKIMEGYPSIGIIEGTTGEAYVRAHFGPGYRIVSLDRLEEVRDELLKRRIDIFVHDAPAVVGLVAKNESVLKGLWEPLNEEYLGWGVNRGDPELLAKVNAALTRWKKDGTLRRTVLKWLPYWKHFE